MLLLVLRFKCGSVRVSTPVLFLCYVMQLLLLWSLHALLDLRFSFSLSTVTSVLDFLLRLMFEFLLKFYFYAMRCYCFSDFSMHC